MTPTSMANERNKSDRRGGRSAASIAATAGHPLRDLSDTLGNQGIQRLGPAAHPATISTAVPPGTIQRSYAGSGSGAGECPEPTHILPWIRRMEDPAGSPPTEAVAPTALAGHGPGHPLDTASRRLMEPHFGGDLGGVRVHTDTAAAHAARMLSAHAFTVGQDIYFGGGKYRPDSASGRRLLAHELTHTRQQGTAAPGVGPAPPSSALISHPHDTAEVEAERVADRVVTGVSPGTRSSVGTAETKAVGNAPAAAAASPGVKDTAGAAPTTTTAAAGAHPSVGEAPAGTPSKTRPAPKAAGAKPAGPHESGGKGEATQAASAHAGVPAGPQHDPAFQHVVAKAHAVAAVQRKHVPVAAKVAQAHAAAAGPAGEVAGVAAAKQVGEMDRQQPGPFDRAKFKAALLQKIADAAPKTLGDAETFKQDNKLAGAKGELQGTVKDAKAEAAGSITQTTTETPDTSGITPKPVTPLPQPEPAPAPPDIGAAAAAPKPQPDAVISLQAGPRAIDQQMASANVTDEQLKQSNEPAFTGALDAKHSAEKESAAAPTAFRAQEQSTLQAARAGAASAAVNHLGTMHGQRGKLLAASLTKQDAAKALDEKRRAEVTDHIKGIYDTCKQAVEARLTKLDTDVDQTFDKGATDAQQAFQDYVDSRVTDYKINRYLVRIGGSLLWAKDLLFGMPDEVNAFYREGRDLYIARMDQVLDSVIAVVDKGLTEAKALIAKARQEITGYVAGLDPSLKQIGQKAATDIGGKLTELEHSVDEKQNQLIDTLAKKYTERLQQIDDKIAAMKAENGGLIDAVKEAVAGVIRTIINLKNLLLGVLARAADAIDLIIGDPIGFLGNLVSAVKLGVQNFASRIGEHMKQGFMEWLFGEVAQAGIQLPKTFDLKGIFGLVLQVLGLTYANFRARAVALLGEKVVAALEAAAEIFKTLITEGPAGLWNWIKEKLGDLKAMVIDQIRNFIIEKVIVAGITWVIGLLNPASAFVKACKAIYDIIMFFVEHGSQILALVNAVIDSVTAIAKGAIGGAADMVENALARAIPVAIGFFAGLLGVGGISEKIKEVIQKIRAPINAAIDWVILKAVALVKAAGKFVGGLFGGKKDEKPSQDKDLGDVKNAARDALLGRLGNETTAETASAAVRDVQQQFASLGLHAVEIGPEEGDGSRPIYASASPRSRIGVLARKRVIVSLSAKIKVRDRAGATLQGADITAGMNRPYSQTTPAPQRFDLYSDIAGGQSEKMRAALAGTSPSDPDYQEKLKAVTGRVARLPEVTQPPGTPARKGATQRSSGLIIEPAAGSTEMEVVAWNTGEPLREQNTSHAEHQFVEWFDHRSLAWKERVVSIVLLIEGRKVCKYCRPELNGMRERYPWIEFEFPGETIDLDQEAAGHLEVKGG